MTRTPDGATPDVDFDLGGFVGVRLLDARPPDVATVVRQLGPIRSTLDRDPDITVRFMDRIDDVSPMTFVGLHASGWTENRFYVLRGTAGRRARAAMPLDQIGQGIEITCERAMGAVPLLVAIVNLTALGNGVLPLHASAFEYRGLGVLAAGWAKGGKTETLLAAISGGASYVGDEWVYLTPDRRMHGVPEPIRMWRWQLQQLPAMRSRLAHRDIVRMNMLETIARTAERGAALDHPRWAASILGRAAPVLRRQVYTQVAPARLFGARSIAPSGGLDEILLAVSHDEPGVRIERIRADEVVDRMTASLEEERSPFMSCYRQFRFAFPDRLSKIVENAAELERELLSSTLESVSAHRVRHPYPVEIERLRESLEQIIDARPTTHRGSN